MTTSPTLDDRIDPQARRVLMTLIVGGVAAVLDSTIVAIAVHTLVSELHTTVGTIQWVSTGYLLALAVAIPLVGWAQARFGGRRLWLFALTLFVLGSALCALAWDAPSLIAFRVVQGLGGGMIFPLMQTLAIQSAGGRNLGRVAATVSLPIAVGPILGPVLGGFILHWLSWQWLFLVNVPLCAVGLVLAWRVLPDDRPTAGAAPARLDLAGLALLTPALVGILLGLSDVHRTGGLARGDVQVPLVLGLVLLAAFVLRAVRRPQGALIDLGLLRNRPVATSSAVMFLTGACMYGAMFLLPLYWQTVRGFDVLTAAFLLIPQGVGSLLSRVVAGSLTDRIGARWVAVVGFVVVGASTAPFALAGAGTNLWWLGAVLFVRGLGLGAVLIPVMTVAYLGLDRAAIPHASMITRITQQVGGSFGTAVVAVVLQGAVVTQGSAGTAGIAAASDRAFWWTIGFTGVAAVGSMLLPTRKTEAPVPPARATTSVS